VEETAVAEQAVRQSAIHRTKVGKSNGERTFAGMRGNDKVAPRAAIPDLRNRLWPSVREQRVGTHADPAKTIRG